MDCLMVFLFITNECQRHCDHCYNPSSTEKMSPEVANRAIQWIKNTCIDKEVQGIKTVFLGGEPLQSVDRLFQIVDGMNQVLPLIGSATDEGKYLSFTNADLFTDEILRGFKSRKIRVLFNPTYLPIEEVEERLLKIKSICGGCSLSVVLNDFNMPRGEELAKLAVKHHCNIRINRLYSGGKDSDYVEQYRQTMHKILDVLLEAEKPLWPNWIMESTWPTWRGVKNPYSCGKWLVIIDPDGTIRSCNPDKDTAIGHIDTHRWDDLKFPQRWSAKNIPECQECEWKTLCQGGCPYTKKVCYGNYYRPSPFCSAFKELYPKIMKLVEKYEYGRVS